MEFLVVGVRHGAIRCGNVGSGAKMHGMAMSGAPGFGVFRQGMEYLCGKGGVCIGEEWSSRVMSGAAR